MIPKMGEDFFLSACIQRDFVFHVPMVQTGKDGIRKNAVLAILGESPAVLMETLWALAKENPPIFPDEIAILTTETGAKRFREQIKETRAWFTLNHTQRNRACGFWHL